MRPPLRRALLAALGSVAFATTTIVVGTVGVATAAATEVKINEVESNGDPTGDWVELYNTGSTPVDIGNFVFSDNSSATYVIPAGTIIAPGAFLVVNDNSAGSPGFSFGLGAADTAELFGTDGTTVIDTYSWTAHAASTYGRCPDGSGAFVATASSKGVANSCGGGGTTTTSTTVPAASALPWPGDPGVQTVDLTSTFTSNLSGLTYEGSGSATPGVLWGARNGPGALFRLVFDGTNWVPDTNNNWGAGKLVHYPDGTGEPDAEGVTFGGPTSADGLFVASERNNANNGVSRNSILRFDASDAGAQLTATREWNITADIPANGANLGLEAITWVPDTFLTSKGFFDENKGHVYVPGDYPDHGNGLFFVGVEATGTIYAYELDQAGTTFKKIATIASGFPAVMGLELDRDLQDLWAVCDDTCNGRSAVLRISPATGKFGVTLVFERPAGIVSNLNDEGFAIAAATECVNGRKPAFWADDNDTGGNSLRRGNLPCTALAVSLPPDIPEFPQAALASLIATGLLGGVVVVRRRRTT